MCQCRIRSIFYAHAVENVTRKIKVFIDHINSKCCDFYMFSSLLLKFYYYHGSSVYEFCVCIILTGAVELAAVGVSIAVFNQVSRIAIFPLVSITTSFVAEEDTLRGWSNEVLETENLEKGLAMDNEMEELITRVGNYSK